MQPHEQIAEKLGKIEQWQESHGTKDDLNFKEIKERLDLIPNKEEFEQIIRDTLVDVLYKAGKGTKGFIIAVAMVIGALAIIGGAGKWLLGLFGYHLIK